MSIHSRKRKSTYSFDIFDTCLIRTCGFPEVVFDILAERVLGTKVSKNILIDFAAERRMGELKARRALINKEKEEVSLSDIYDFCNFSLYSDTDKREIARIELEIEEEVLCPVYSIKEEIRQLHEKNIPVLFISDMYLPEEFIVKILKNKGLYEAKDSVFVSSKVYKAKHTGNLFRFVHESLNLDYEDWCHKGDNRISDYNVPIELGIKAVLIKHEYSRFEKSLINKDIYINQSCLARIASFSRAIRLSYEENPSISFAADFIAPLYVPFVYSILEDARNKGLKNLFFLARDGYILYLIAKELSPLFPEINMQYVYVSRKSLYLPGLPNVTEESLKNLFLVHEKISVDEVLDRLQMEDYDYEKINPKVSENIVDPIAGLLNDNVFMEKLKRRQKEQEQYCIEYFEEIGLASPYSAIIDLAGTRKSHESINQILRKAGHNGVYGYYFEVLPDRIKGVNYKALYYLDRYEINERRINPLTPQEIFEQYFSITDQNRTVSYQKTSEGKVIPVFEKDSMDIDYKRNVMENNRIVCSLFSNYYMNYIKGNHDYICRNAANVYSEFYQLPTYFYLKALVGLRYSNSRLQSVPVLVNSNFFRVVKNRRRMRWHRAQIIYNSPIPNVIEKLYGFIDAIKKVK